MVEVDPVSKPPRSVAIDMMLATLVVSTALLQAPALSLTASPKHPLGTLREQAAVQQEWLRYRLDSVLPHLMRRYKVAMWVVPMREYNEDPVFWSLVSATSFCARRSIPRSVGAPSWWDKHSGICCAR